MLPRALWRIRRFFAENALLKVGVILIVVAVTLTAGVAVAVVSFRGAETAGTTPVSSSDPEAAEEDRFDTGEKLDLEDERQAKTLPVTTENWPQPSQEQIQAASGPRYYQPTGDAELTLTVEAIGLYGVPVINSESKEALDRGVIHLPQTPMPWEEREQKNVYLAGHRLGWPGTGSHLVFFNLDKLRKGDSVVLSDLSGNTYEYRVSEMFTVYPMAEWAIDPVRGRDTVTLQTCTYPDLQNRIIVRADRVR